MGTGMCSSRRQKSLLHTGFCLLLVLALATGIFLYNHIVQKAKSSEALALRNKQQQEALSAQLQVVYEHRSRLERSLQKERSEHKKTKEDFLVYKLEAQEALNKEKQDSMNRYGALSSQNKILKNQHDDLKKQFSDLQNEHSNLKLEHRKALETHGQRLSQVQRDKEKEMLGLQDTILKLREESKLLRKAHNDVHTQLRNAQMQMDEFRQLKDALKKMPSFKNSVPETENLQLPSNKQVSQLNDASQNRLGNYRFMADRPIPGAEMKRVSHGPLHKQDGAVFQSPSEGVTPHGSWSQNESISHVVRIARTVNSLQSLKKDTNQQVIQKAEERQDIVPGIEFISDLPAAPGRERLKVRIVTAKEQVPIQSWQAIVNKVNARMTEEDIRFGASDAAAKLEMSNANVPVDKWDKEAALPPSYKKAENNEELEMDAGMIDREENLQSRKQHVVQEPLVPDDAADPAKDPNNQGEDEFEEAEVDRPEFNHKASPAEQLVQPLAAKEEHGGELDNGDDLDEDHKRADTQDIKSKRDDYY
ncbi:Golgi integral membrane protein 4 isoform X2 [Xenopus laevis]|uniref:Golgi integral membrane protein 4 isoform X2 n=1 Tax=Xenopus laevis TaxID=8355 RepID=A0A8J1L9I9_XENLA|nr:Golgi integral membrane protein 4 isoform X2 [Xenopus laevis]